MKKRTGIGRSLVMGSWALLAYTLVVGPLPAQDAPVEGTTETLNEAGEPTQIQRRGERFRLGSKVRVAENESVSDAVSVFGGTVVHGIVRGDMVSVFGGSELTGEAQQDMVTVFGSSKMTGSVARDMVTVFGNSEVNGPVDGDLVTVFGSVKLGPEAKVDGDCVAVFGKLEQDSKAYVDGEAMEIMPWFSGLGDYLRYGLLWGRLIPPSSILAWVFVALHLVLYLLVALLLPRPVESCVRQLRERPLQSFGVGLLTMLILAPLYFILVASGVGAFLVPMLWAVELCVVILGKTAVIEFLGFQVVRRPAEGQDSRAIPAFFVGFAILTLIYMVPVVGLLTWALLRPWSIGAALMPLFVNGKKNGAPPLPPAPPIPVQTGDSTDQAATANLVSAQPVTESKSSDGDAGAESSGETPAPPLPPKVTPATVAMMPRSGFWIRLLATGLDFLALCWILMLPWIDHFFLLFWLAYHIGMWTWKGTTIGGIVCNLKVVRLDGRQVDVGVALVRALASIFSAVALGLGFFWVGWTHERQSWHDKIAGTVIVRVPKGIPML